MLFSPLTREEEKESVRHRFLQFKNAQVTKRTGLPPGKPDFKLVPQQDTQIFDQEGPA